MDRLLYATALVLYLGSTLGRRSRFADRFVVRNAVWAGLAVHVFALVLHSVHTGKVPLDSMEWGLSAISLLVVGAWTWLKSRPRLDVVGLVAMPLAMVLLAGAVVGPESDDIRDYDTVWFPLHVGMLLVGIAGFALSFALSSLYLVVRRRLKDRRLEGIARMPSLDALDRLNFWAMATGFVTLTIGMALGAAWGMTHADSDRNPPDVTIYATSVVWLWYALGLHMRLIVGWRGRLAAVIGVVGFAGLAVLVTTSFALRGWHAFGSQVP